MPIVVDDWEIPLRVSINDFPSDYESTKHAGPQLFLEQRKLPLSQHGALVCAQNQGGEAWGKTGYESKMVLQNRRNPFTTP